MALLPFILFVFPFILKDIKLQLAHFSRQKIISIRLRSKLLRAVILCDPQMDNVSHDIVEGGKCHLNNDKLKRLSNTI